MKISERPVVGDDVVGHKTGGLHLGLVGHYCVRVLRGPIDPDQIAASRSDDGGLIRKSGVGDDDRLAGWESVYYVEHLGDPNVIAKELTPNLGAQPL